MLHQPRRFFVPITIYAFNASTAPCSKSFGQKQIQFYRIVSDTNVSKSFSNPNLEISCRNVTEKPLSQALNHVTNIGSTQFTEENLQPFQLYRGGEILLESQ